MNHYSKYIGYLLNMSVCDFHEDSGDEISSDCLDLAPHEEDSSDEEPQMHRHITRGRSRGEEQGNPAISHLRDSFVPADVEREEDFQTDESEQLSDPSMVRCFHIRCCFLQLGG